MAGSQRHHDNREERVDEEVDPVGGIPATAALIETTLVDLAQDSHQPGGQDEDKGQAAPCTVENK